MRYGSQQFLAASNWARSLPRPFRVSALASSVLSDPALIRVLAAIWRLPVIDIQVRRADLCASAAAYFSRSGYGRLARAVLELPLAEERYLVGRPRQALRTNLRHARELGVTSGRVPYETWFEAASAILGARNPGDTPGNQGKSGPGRQMAYYVARDAGGIPLVFAGAELFGQFAGLFVMTSHNDRRPCTSWARYQLHTFLALDLGSSGVRYLVAGNALREPPGHQYFQHLLGYQACNLRVHVIEPGATPNLPDQVRRPARGASTHRAQARRMQWMWRSARKIR
jgi:hypothetical protein